MSTCVFVVDLQRGFITDRTREVLPKISGLLRSQIFDHVAFTQFHNELGSPFRRFLQWNRLSSEAEQALAPEFDRFAHVIFRKSAYSAVNPETINYVMANAITDVFVIGVDTDCCVLKTAVDFFEIGVRSRVLEHYSASNGGPTSHQCAIRVLERLIGRGNIIRGPLDKEGLKTLLHPVQQGPNPTSVSPTVK